ncbi:enoyl-CoA hydratase [Peribacillus muralis]|uniref:enoyl-CoA hydratase n=1 Tax=Peribacillus muralis TaxID=264697 RepID=UPI00070E2CEF|nr:enoyl-CoA hydratase [Peribacillus muralis]
MTYENILFEQIGPIARISHNRPKYRNAENKQLLKELDDAIVRAGKDESIRVVILAGKGDHFSAGHDLKEGQAERGSFTLEDRWMYEEEYYFDYCMKIWNLPKPTIAQVQGACIAGGFMVANMCDLMIASEDAFFADPVVHSMAVTGIEVMIHPWVLGARKAKELLFTGERLTAQDALASGMVNKVVTKERLEEETLALAQRISEAQPFALKLVKKSLNRTLDIQGLRNSLDAHFDTHLLSHFTEESKLLNKTGLEKVIQRSKALNQK